MLYWDYDIHAFYLLFRILYLFKNIMTNKLSTITNISNDTPHYKSLIKLVWFSNSIFILK